MGNDSSREIEILVEALREARWEIYHEWVAAGGEDEAMYNASLRAKGRLIDKLDLILASKEARHAMMAGKYAANGGSE